ncbi:MAG TPA: hypothetical protein VKD04_02255 [Burkholderiales bacterium]|nr:hypothetical protein [Burkholderiales bacterium]
MRTTITVLYAVLSFSVLAQDSGPLRLAPHGIHVVPINRGAEMFYQCSRPAPMPDEPLWTPSSEDIAQLESDLKTFLASRKAAGQTVPPPTAVYHRQYVGFTRKGTRLIYGNFFPKDAVDLLRDGPLRVCDGGPFFWGIVYSPANRELSELEFNGPD